MKLTAMALATVLGLSTPLASTLVMPDGAIAMPSEFNYPTGAFRDVRTDNTWLVNLQINEFGAYTYWGTNLQTADSLSLSQAAIGGSSRRQTYTFRNGAYQYIIAHQPADPDYIRLTVMDPQGNELLNELMVKVGNDWDL